MNWGSFAGGLAKTWNPKVIGGAINENLMTSGLEENQEAYKAALEDANYKEVDDTGAEINRYDDATRKQKIADAEKALKESNENTVRKWKGEKGLQEWKSQQMANENTEMDLEKKKGLQALYESWSNGSALKDPANLSLLNSSKQFMSYFFPQLKDGTFVQNGDNIGLEVNGKLVDVDPGMMSMVTKFGAGMAALGKYGDPNMMKELVSMYSSASKSGQGYEGLGILAAKNQVGTTSGQPNFYGAGGVPGGNPQPKPQAERITKEEAAGASGNPKDAPRSQAIPVPKLTPAAIEALQEEIPR